MMSEHILFKDSVISDLLHVAMYYENNVALKIKRFQLTYGELFNYAKNVAQLIQHNQDSKSIILAKRNAAAYIALLGSMLAGKTYLFLNTKDKQEKLEDTIAKLKPCLLIVDRYNFERIEFFLSRLKISVQCVVIESDGKTLNYIKKNKENSLIESTTELDVYMPPHYISNIVYIMFTSGSTGVPKKIPITHHNLRAFLNNIIDRIRPNQADVFSQINELTFDFSVYDIFTCWSVGACLCVLPDNYVLSIDKYIVDNNISYWSSVPSFISLLQKLNKLSINNYKTIRYSVFCGEALTNETVAIWKQAAPNTIVDNLYGPTEATVAISGHVWHDNIGSTVPIGHLFSGQTFYLIDDEEKIVEGDKIGELCIGGTQVMSGYWEDPELSHDKFILINANRYYKTGDLAFFDGRVGLIYKGRKDDQLKIRGYRVEKIEIENMIKSLITNELVAIVAISNELTNLVESLICFVANTVKTVDEMLKICRKEMPDHMQPTKIIKLKELPYNKNLKVDYKKLRSLALNNL